MIYGPGNARGASVRVAETGQELKGVMLVDTDAGIVTRTHLPARLNAEGDEVETFDDRFEVIHAIQGMEPRPVLFICYGRLA